jgi:hypothetical protein
MEPVFHTDSYGYRPRRSAIDVVRTARQRCWRPVQPALHLAPGGTAILSGPSEEPDAQVLVTHLSL